MDEYINELKINFFKIKKSGFVKSINNSTSSVGITFEHLLGKQEDSSYRPDYKGIELKCKTTSFLYPITLFSVAFDGPGFNETKRLADLYGNPDAVYTNLNGIYCYLNCTKNYTLNDKYLVSLKCDRVNKKLFMVVKDLDNNIIEEESYITFDTLKYHLYKKLKYLALVSAEKATIDDSLYFRYNKMEIFNLLEFDKFIDCLENGIIDCSLILRIRKSGKDAGEYDYKNISFMIKPMHLKYIYEKN